MATVLEKCIAAEQRLVALFSVDKKINAKNIYDKMFPVCRGKIVSRKAVYSWVENVSLMTKMLKRKCGSQKTEK
jgi:hypothetical protein